ncbi:transporter [Mycobacterium kyorinense]|uniref:Transporter n=1 Tax=Mycobacterium kyorinense TaxID=487514 RepID=A0A1A2YXY0_9MYCO|nr:RDD family protein [Mycobacterium kyorinense]OBI41771.1 transporter [Mycobacterium kyorinense]
MARSIASWLSGPGPLNSDGQQRQYPGETLDLPERGPGSLARMGRRLAALLVDWLLAYGLAALGLTLGLVSPGQLSTTVLVIWLVLGMIAVRLFEFTPGQFALGLRVKSVDGRMHVGLGRAALRGVLIAVVIPALFVDIDGRGLQDRVTGTAVVRR